MGVKGPSWLQCLKSFDIINGMSVKYMHCALLGVSKLLLSLWTDTSRCRGSCHNIRDAIPLIDKMLISNVKTPYTIRRKPRGLTEMKHWKGAALLIYSIYVMFTASEYRSWVLFYGVGLLKDFLHSDYYQHFLYFSNALWLMLQTSVTFEDVLLAEELLHNFCKEFGVLYGDRYFTANVHMLLHFADCVRNLGPLWAHSTFPFEDANGWLTELFHGTRDAHKQVHLSFVLSSHGLYTCRS
jgi:hypothetical protein